MNKIKYVLFNVKDYGFGPPKFSSKIVEQGEMGYDCAALLSRGDFLKTSLGNYYVFVKKLDVSGDEAKLVIYVDQSPYWAKFLDPEPVAT